MSKVIIGVSPWFYTTEKVSYNFNTADYHANNNPKVSFFHGIKQEENGAYQLRIDDTDLIVIGYELANMCNKDWYSDEY